MKAIRTETIITSISSRQDGSLRCSLVTPELTTAERSEFMELQNMVLDTLITPKDMKTTDLMEIDKEAGQKSPSERLRAVLYIYYEQKYGDDKKIDFNTFYIRNMEAFINLIKDKLEK